MDSVVSVVTPRLLTSNKTNCEEEMEEVEEDWMKSYRTRETRAQLEQQPAELTIGTDGQTIRSPLAQRIHGYLKILRQAG